MKALTWKEPPPSNRGARDDIREILVQLKARPGSYALLAEGAKSQSASATWKKHGCETAVRRNDKASKLFDVYVRWPKQGAKPMTTEAPRPAKPTPAPQSPAPQPRPRPRESVGTGPLPDSTGDPGLDRYNAKRRARGVLPGGRP